MKEFIKLIRPHQYLKNLFIFLPLFFSIQIQEVELLINTCIAFLAFSLCASSIYILNDYRDIEDDQKHPEKKFRPLASGAIKVPTAMMAMIIFMLTGFGVMYSLSLNALFCLVFYVIMNIAYSIRLKHVAILDVVIIAVGFVIRVFVGIHVINVSTSMWIIVMTFLLASFLGLAKRRDDVLIFMKTGQKMRKVIDGYNLQFLDVSMTMMGGVVIVAYLMYCVSPEVIARTGSDQLYITALFVIIGIMRYMQITFVRENSGNPTKILIKDRLIHAVLILWISTFTYLIY